MTIRSSEDLCNAIYARLEQLGFEFEWPGLHEDHTPVGQALEQVVLLRWHPYPAETPPQAEVLLLSVWHAGLVWTASGTWKYLGQGEFTDSEWEEAAPVERVAAWAVLPGPYNPGGDE